MIIDLGRYIMRSGATATVTEKRRAKPAAKKWYFWVGKDEETGATLTWQPDGRYAVYGKHPHDLVARAEDQPRTPDTEPLQPGSFDADGRVVG